MEQRLTIEWSIRAVRDMRRLAPQDRQRILARVEQYARNPESLSNQVIMLVGSRYRRLRVGDHRVLFNVERGETPIMAVLRVRHRSEAYD
ncbi:MAG: type II toxin-antitoxin system RelE/ParE family toxin [Chloroflexi bacterium]|nr:type II toxin-antitoxin system RelE/ParE family toxin [Chloroflexota bacterium]